MSRSLCMKNSPRNLSYKSVVTLCTYVRDVSLLICRFVGGEVRERERERFRLETGRISFSHSELSLQLQGLPVFYSNFIHILQNLLRLVVTNVMLLALKVEKYYTIHGSCFTIQVLSLFNVFFYVIYIYTEKLYIYTILHIKYLFL